MLRVRRRPAARPHGAAGPLAAARFSFALDGTVLNIGSAPKVGEWDVICVNSDGLILGIGGFVDQVSSLGSQDSHIFVRQAVGGEGSTATVSLGGDNNAAAVWTRWPADFSAATPGGAVQAGGSGIGTPAGATGALPAGSTVLAYAALHGIGAANQTAPVWMAGVTPVTFSGGSTGPAVQGAGGTGCAAWVGFAVNAPPAGLAVGMTSWTGDPANDRYTLLTALTP